jgi:hypothetical protein
MSRYGVEDIAKQDDPSGATSLVKSCGEAADKLWGAVIELEERLGPVRQPRPEPPMPSGEDSQVAAIRSPLVMSLEAHRDRLRDLGRRVAMLTDQVEL